MGARLALDAPLGALRLRRRRRLPAQGLSRPEGSLGVPPRLPGRGRAGPAGDEPLALAREHLPRREGQRGRSVRGRHDGLRDHPRALRDCLRAAEVLGQDAEFRAGSSAQLDRLPPYQVGKHGQLQEWLKDFDEAEPGHRHVSQLFALHPGHSITLRATPELARRRRVSLERRLRHGGGGRAGAGRGSSTSSRGSATASVRTRTCTTLLAKSTPAQPVRHPPAVPDRRQFRRHGRNRRDAAAEPRGRARSSAGAAAGLADGRVTGLRARGGFEVDLAWKDGVLERAVVRSRRGEPCRVRYGQRTVQLETRAGGVMTLDATLGTR